MGVWVCGPGVRVSVSIGCYTLPSTPQSAPKCKKWQSFHICCPPRAAHSLSPSATCSKDLVS